MRCHTAASGDHSTRRVPRERSDRHSVSAMHARILLLLWLLAGIAPLGRAAGPTLVSGNISGTWSPENSPYLLVDHCTVPADKTLAIQPGTESSLAMDWAGP